MGSGSFLCPVQVDQFGMSLDVAAANIKRLSTPTFWDRKDDFYQVMGKYYEDISRHAIQSAYGETILDNQNDTNYGETNMARRKQPKDVDVYQLKVTLAYSKPPIWRRVQIRGDTTLQKLHRIIQDAMGWEDYHLHKFIIGEKYYGEPDDFFPGTINEKNVKLSEVIPGEKTKFTYEYDFGDSWNHDILIEKILPVDPDLRYPVCLKGKRACPPEDCGGIDGYYGLLDVLANPDYPEYEDMIEWIDENFDPDAFDLDDVNLRLRGIK